MPATASERAEDLAAVPYLPAMIERIVTASGIPHDRAIRILELAAGGGHLAAALLRQFTNAEATLLEPDADLRAAAQERLAPFADRSQIATADFTNADLPRGFDLVVSLFGFHGVDDIPRRAAYRAIYSALLPNGVMLIGDSVRGPTESLQAIYREVWRRDAEREGIAPDMLARVEARFGSGRGMLLTNEQTWLMNIGYRDIEVRYKNLGFAVFGGRRPVASDFTIAEDGTASLRRRPGR